MPRWLILGVLLMAAPAPAAGVQLEAAPDLAALKARIEAGRAAEAEAALRAALADAPGDADILNLLGYANRKLGRLDASRGYYLRALAAEPDHRGALEYMGELELAVGDVDAAQALLARLRAACPAGCDELDELIEAFKAKGVEPGQGT